MQEILSELENLLLQKIQELKHDEAYTDISTRKTWTETLESQPTDGYDAWAIIEGKSYLFVRRGILNSNYFQYRLDAGSGNIHPELTDDIIPNKHLYKETIDLVLSLDDASASELRDTWRNEPLLLSITLDNDGTVYVDFDEEYVMDIGVDYDCEEDGWALLTEELSIIHDTLHGKKIEPYLIIENIFERLCMYEDELPPID